MKAVELIAQRLQALERKTAGSDDSPFASATAPAAAEVPDWASLGEKFATEFPPRFVAFFEAAAGFDLIGLLNTDEDGTIASVYDQEMGFGRWDPDKIPFYDIGDLTYYCLSASRGPQSPVYHSDHGGGYAVVAASFDEWIDRLEEFVA